MEDKKEELLNEVTEIFAIPYFVKSEYLLRKNGEVYTRVDIHPRHYVNRINDAPGAFVNQQSWKGKCFHCKEEVNIAIPPEFIDYRSYAIELEKKVVELGRLCAKLSEQLRNKANEIL